MVTSVISVSSVPSCGNKIGSYETGLLENGNIEIVTIQDQCLPRAGDTSGEKEPVESPPPGGSVNLLNGLVACYPFDGDANDASGNGHHGTVVGATLPADRNGEDGKAYSFDGEDDFISVMDPPDFDIEDGDMTILLWLFHQEDPTFKGILSHTNGALATDGWWLTLDQLRGELFCMAGRDHIWRPSAPLDTWVHLAFVKGGSAITFYFDGVAQGSPIDHGKQITDSDGELRTGMEGSCFGEQFFLGKIDEVRLYNRALSVEEILAVMNALLQGSLD